MARSRQEIQREVADEVLHKLSDWGIDAFLAGGAPRDWYFERDAKDLDFYFPSGSERDQMEDLLSKMGLDVTRIPKPITVATALRSSFSGPNDWLLPEPPIPKEYTGNPDLEFVIDASYKGERLQFMSVKDIKTVVDNFPLSLCQATYKDGTISTTRLFDLSLQEGMIFRTGKEYNSKTQYFEKIKRKFPDFKPVGF